MNEILNFILHQLVGIIIFVVLWGWYLNAGTPKK
jgi:hypothetical protein